MEVGTSKTVSQDDECVEPSLRLHDTLADFHSEFTSYVKASCFLGEIHELARNPYNEDRVIEELCANIQTSSAALESLRARALGVNAKGSLPYIGKPFGLSENCSLQLMRGRAVASCLLEAGILVGLWSALLPCHD